MDEEQNVQKRKATSKLRKGIPTLYRKGVYQARKTKRFCSHPTLLMANAHHKKKL